MLGRNALAQGGHYAWIFQSLGLKNICGYIKNGTISVSCSYYKIVFKDKGTEKIEITLILNNQGSSSTLKSIVTSIDNIEALTGIDFFSSLSDDIDNKKGESFMVFVLITQGGNYLFIMYKIVVIC
jgi:hypothetical protein